MHIYIYIVYIYISLSLTFSKILRPCLCSLRYQHVMLCRPIQKNPVELSTPSMTGGGSHRTLPSLGGLKPLCFHPYQEKYKSRGHKGCERDTTQNFLHSCPASGTLVVQSYWAWNLSALGQMGSYANGSDGLTGVYSSSPVGVRLVPLKTHDFGAFSTGF